MLRRIIFILFLLPSFGFTQNGNDFTGIWQNSPSIASGWSDTYLFFSNGTFIFHYNQMVCDNRNISYSGKWKASNEGEIILTINSKTVLEGGTLVKSTGSCASEYEIEGGEVKVIQLWNPESKAILFSDYKIDSENNSRETVLFNNVRFWRISNNPENYN
jgi:hypothetical protein